LWQNYRRVNILINSKVVSIAEEYAAGGVPSRLEIDWVVSFSYRKTSKYSFHGCYGLGLL